MSISIYRRASAEALQVITGCNSLDFLMIERKENYDVLLTDETRERTVEEWQARWDGNVTKGQWTKTLIHPNIRQLLTGHCSFKKYIHRIPQAK